MLDYGVLPAGVDADAALIQFGWVRSMVVNYLLADIVRVALFQPEVQGLTGRCSAEHLGGRRALRSDDRRHSKFLVCLFKLLVPASFKAFISMVHDDSVEVQLLTWRNWLALTRRPKHVVPHDVVGHVEHLWPAVTDVFASGVSSTALHPVAAGHVGMRLWRPHLIEIRNHVGCYLPIGNP